MNSLLSYILTPASSEVIQVALMVIRVGIGVLMVMHGFPKITGGYTLWQEIGQAVSYFNIHVMYGFWGLLAACTEFFGGISLVLGLGTRITSIFLFSMMVVALRYHIAKGDSFMVYSHALALLVIFAGFLLLGGGRFSLDYILTR